MMIDREEKLALESHSELERTVQSRSAVASDTTAELAQLHSLFDTRRRSGEIFAVRESTRRIERS